MNFPMFKSVLDTWEWNSHCSGNLHMASAFQKSPYVSNFKSKCPSNTFELGNMYFLLLEIHSLRNYHQFPYKLSTDPSARKGTILVKKCFWILIWESEINDMLLVWCWIWWGWDEAGAGVIKSIIGCNLPLLLFNKDCCSFSHICICLCSYFSCNGFLNDIYVSHLIDLSD